MFFSLANYEKIYSEPKISYMKEIFFDTNVISKFKYLDKAELSYKESLKKLVSNLDGYGWNIILYINENSMNSNFQKDKKDIIDTLNNYEKFCRKYSQNNEEKSLSEKVEIYWNKIVDKRKNKYEDDYEYNIIYVVLLYTVYIKLIKEKKSAKKRIELLIEFIDKELMIYPENELLLCFKYMQNNKKLCDNFFKLSKIDNETIKKVKNRSWDLCHLRFLEKDFLYCDGVIRLPYITTLDKGFIEILKYNPLKFVEINNNSVSTIHEKNILTEFPEYKKIIQKLNNTQRRKKIMSLNTKERDEKVKKIIKKIEKLIQEENDRYE